MSRYPRPRSSKTPPSSPTARPFVNTVWPVPALFSSGSGVGASPVPYNASNPRRERNDYAAHTGDVGSPDLAPLLPHPQCDGKGPGLRSGAEGYFRPRENSDGDLPLSDYPMQQIANTNLSPPMWGAVKPVFLAEPNGINNSLEENDYDGLSLYSESDYGVHTDSYYSTQYQTDIPEGLARQDPPTEKERRRLAQREARVRKKIDAKMGKLGLGLNSKAKGRDLAPQGKRYFLWKSKTNGSQILVPSRNGSRRRRTSSLRRAGSIVACTTLTSASTSGPKPFAGRPLATILMPRRKRLLTAQVVRTCRPPAVGIAVAKTSDSGPTIPAVPANRIWRRKAAVPLNAEEGTKKNETAGRRRRQKSTDNGDGGPVNGMRWPFMAQRKSDAMSPIKLSDSSFTSEEEDNQRGVERLSRSRGSGKSSSNEAWTDDCRSDVDLYDQPSTGIDSVSMITKNKWKECRRGSAPRCAGPCVCVCGGGVANRLKARLSLRWNTRTRIIDIKKNEKLRGATPKR